MEGKLLRFCRDLLYIGLGSMLVLYSIFSIIREIVEFGRFVLIPLFLLQAALGIGIVKTRLQERDNNK